MTRLGVQTVQGSWVLRQKHLWFCKPPLKSPKASSEQEHQNWSWFEPRLESDLPGRRWVSVKASRWEEVCKVSDDTSRVRPAGSGLRRPLQGLLRGNAAPC